MEYKKLIDKMKIFTFIFIFLISFDEIKIRKTIYYKCYIFLATTTSVFGHVYIFFNVVQAFHKLHIFPNNKQLPQFQSSDNYYMVYLVKNYYSPVPNPERLKSSLNFLIL